MLPDFLNNAQLSNYAKDTFAAPEMSKFTELNAPDLANETMPSLSGLLMTRILGRPRDDRQHGLELNFVRRTIGSASQYTAAQAAAHEYLGDRSRWGDYYVVLEHFEASISQVAQAHELLIAMLPEGERDNMKKNAPASYISVKKLYEASKHTLAKEKTRQPLAVWLTNEGIEGNGQGKSVCLTYDLLASLIDELARIAILFCTRQASER